MLQKSLPKLGLVLVGILLSLIFQFAYNLITEKYIVFVADAAIGSHYPVSGITVNLGTANCGDLPCLSSFPTLTAKTNEQGKAIFPAYRFPFFSPKTGGYSASIAGMTGEFVRSNVSAKTGEIKKIWFITKESGL